MEILIKDLSYMKKFASLLADISNKKDVICLNGNLGTGKTTFTQFFASSLGIKEIVNSPTFNIIKCYFSGKINLYHIDAYRLEDNTFDIGLEEYIYGDGITIIEWADYIKNILPSSSLIINIERIDENQRLLKLEGNPQIIKEVKEKWENN